MAQVKFQSYAGVSLSINPPDLQERMDRLLPYTDFLDSSYWNFLGFDTSKLPTPDLPKIPRLEPGVLYWPTGATRPAFYHQVVTQAQLDAIREAVTCLTDPYPLVMADGRTGKSITAMMYLLPSRPINQLGTANDGWLLTLADQRFYWYWKTGSIATPSSWEGLYTSIADLLGITITPDTIAAAYQTPSSKWKGYVRPLPTLLDAVASQVGQRVVVGLDGTVSTVNWQTAQAASQTQIGEVRLIAGGLLDESDVARYVPRAMSVAFADWSTGTLAEAPFLSTQYLGLLGISNYEALSCSGVDATGLLYADFSYNAVSATGTVPAYAEQAATDFYGWRLSDLELSIPGIEPWEPTGWEDSIEWIAQLTTYGPSIMTRVRRGPWSWIPSGTYTGDNPDGPNPPNPPVSTDCAAIVGILNRTTSCLELSISAALGDCGCVDTSQTAFLTNNGTGSGFTSDTLLYGCPTGVITTHCPGGAPKKFVSTLSGFTDGCSVLNGTWTFTWAGPGSGIWTGFDTWTGTNSSGVSATLGVEEVSGMLDWGIEFTYSGFTGEVKYTVDNVTGGCCQSITLTANDTTGCSDNSQPSTITVTPATGCGKGTPYTPIVDTCVDSCGRPAPRLRWVPQTGSGAATITFSNEGCGVDGNGSPFMEFYTDNPLLCTGTANGTCGNNYLKVRVTCGSCLYIVPNSECLCTGGIESILCITGISASTGDALLNSILNSVKGPAVYGPLQLIACNGFPTTDQCIYYNSSGYCCNPDICDPNDFTHAWVYKFSFTDGCGVHIGVVNFFIKCIECTGGTTPVEVGVLIQMAYFPETCEAGSIITMQTGNSDSVLLNCTLTPHSLAGTVGADYTFEDQAITVTLAPYTGSCPTEPATPTYNCADGTCVDPGDGTGYFTGPNALGNCQAACGGVTTYNCVDGSCVPVSGTGGEYPTLATCEAGCTGTDPCCDNELRGTDATIVIAGGADAGTYTATWGGSGTTYISFTGDGTGNLYAISCAPPTPDFLALLEGAGTLHDSGYSCSPFALSFSVGGALGWPAGMTGITVT